MLVETYSGEARDFGELGGYNPTLVKKQKPGILI